ncbi:MAG TPA: formate dehydrogenase subunit gamma [Chloroflexi bacterium]|nr:formate dehydrogenase subunit gamma [Chloroflexota bacterium]
MSERWIRRFTPLQQAGHWIFALAFILTMITGAFLYVPAFAAYAIGLAGEASRFLHRLGAAGLFFAVLLYALFGLPLLIRDMREVFSFNAGDRKWLATAPWRYYWTGDRTGLPEEGRYNPGQKLTYRIQVVGFVVLAVTGLIMWLGVGLVPAGLLQASLILHDIAFLVVTGFFFVHLYLSTLHPLTKPSITAMVTGEVTEEYAREHHPRWYREVTEGAGSGQST